MEHLPFVSALLVTRNEKDYIKMSLMSLINQTYPKSCYEIIIIDGESNDGTLDEVKSIQAEYCSDDFSISIIPNPKRILAAGWNLGIKAAKGEYVVRIDAHSVATEDFIAKSVETMMRVNAVCVGGKLISKSLNGDDDVVSKVLSSPFGVGNSSFRVSEQEGYADTAVYGLYKRSIFEEAGYFDEALVRNQDIEMHSRIKAAGGKFYFNPQIQCTYYTRNTVKKMMRQAYGNGYWNMVLLKRGSSALSLRHLVPFAFVLYLILSIIGGFFFKPFWYLAIGVVVFHLCMGFLFATKKSRKFADWMKMPVLFLLLHLSYGAGYLVSLFK